MFFIPVLLIVALINYTIDPSQLFGNGRVEREAAEIILHGENVSNLENFDHRLLQKYYFEGLQLPKDIVVIGSSRAMLLSSSMFPGLTLYNASTAGSSIEDYIAIYDLMVRNEVFPKTLIIEISPWLFNTNSGQVRWKSIATEYLDGLELLEIKNAASDWLSLDLEKYSGLLSFSYLQDSLRWMGRPNGYYATTQTHTGESMKLSDGSRVYSDKNENLTVEEVRAIVKESLTDPYGLENFTEVDKGILDQFTNLVLHLQNAGTRVILFLAPYHPDYYAGLINNPLYQRITNVEETMRQFAVDFNLELVGSYNPELFGCSPDEFYDGFHARRTCIDRIFEDLKQ